MQEIVKKWYKKLDFPACFDKEFYDALNSTTISSNIDLASYDKECQDGIKNLIAYLYFCESAEKLYKSLNIPENILIDTLKDIKSWCITWTKVKGRLFLGEIFWLQRHLTARIFRIGRLQYCMAKSPRDIDKYGIKKGDDVLEIHIPEGERLSTDDCLKSMDMARVFFAKYFSNYDYSVFTCHSWLLDDTLKKFLKSDSGIIAFSSLFDKIYHDPSYSILKFMFTWDTTIDNLIDKKPTSSLAQKVKDAVLSGEKFYETLGVIKK